jgi:hypothetical protein
MVGGRHPMLPYARRAHDLVEARHNGADATADRHELTGLHTGCRAQPPPP